MPVKQGREVKTSHFLVPYTLQDPLRCFASRVIAYLRAVERNLGAIGPKKPLFYRVLKNGYAKQAMGRNYMSDVGKEVAAKLGLEEPER